MPLTLISLDTISTESIIFSSVIHKNRLKLRQNDTFLAVFAIFSFFFAAIANEIYWNNDNVLTTDVNALRGISISLNLIALTFILQHYKIRINILKEYKRIDERTTIRKYNPLLIPLLVELVVNIVVPIPGYSKQFTFR